PYNNTAHAPRLTLRHRRPLSAVRPVREVVLSHCHNDLSYRLTEKKSDCPLGDASANFALALFAPELLCGVWFRGWGEPWSESSGILLAHLLAPRTVRQRNRRQVNLTVQARATAFLPHRPVSSNLTQVLAHL